MLKFLIVVTLTVLAAVCGTLVHVMIRMPLDLLFIIVPIFIGSVFGFFLVLREAIKDWPR